MKEKLRILQVVDNYYPIIDGVVSVADNYSRELNKLADCDALVPWYPNSKYDVGYDVIRSKSMSGGKYGVRLPLPRFDRKLKKHFKENKYDIIHCHSCVTLARYVLKYAKKHNIPVIFTLHTKFHEEINRSLKLKCLQKATLNYLLNAIKKMDYVWAVSEGNKQSLRDDYNLHMPCEIMENGTDMVPLTEAKEKELTKSIREELKIQDDEKILLFVGRLVVVKNLSVVLKAMQKLKDSKTKYRLVFVGGGDYQEELEKEVADLGITDCVTFAGCVYDREKLSAYYRLADLFVFPSIFDTSSLTIKESASMDLPFLTIKGCSTAEPIVDNHNGFLAENTPESWAEKLEFIFNNEDVYKTVKSNCKKELYRSWKMACEEALVRYKEIIKEHKNK